MANSDIETIKKGLVDINTFVKDRFDPATKEMDVLKEESARLKRERAARRDALTALAEDQASPYVQEGVYAGMSLLDLGLVRRIAHSQRRESFGPAWMERVDEARRHVIGAISPASIQGSCQAAARKLRRWHTVDSRPTGQFEGFSRAMLDSMTRAAMDSTTAGSGDDLVATLEARELWVDVNLQTLVAPLIPTFPMPSNPFDIPRQLGDVNFYPGTENVAASSTAPGHREGDAHRARAGRAGAILVHPGGGRRHSHAPGDPRRAGPERCRGARRHNPERGHHSDERHQRGRRDHLVQRRREGPLAPRLRRDRTPAAGGQHQPGQRPRRRGLRRHVQRDPGQAGQVRRPAVAARVGHGRQHLHPEPVHLQLQDQWTSWARTPRC